MGRLKDVEVNSAKTEYSSIWVFRPSSIVRSWLFLTVGPAGARVLSGSWSERAELLSYEAAEIRSI